MTSRPLILLAFAAGCTDAISYLALGRVFTANMTGNTVLLGLALVAGDPARAARSGCALGAFCAGVAFATMLWRCGRRKPRSSLLVLIAELVALAALAIVAATAGYRSAEVYPLIALSGLAMGSQSDLVRRAASGGVTTTYITGTLTRAVAEFVERMRPGGRRENSPEANRLSGAAVWLTYLGAAVVGGAAESWWRVQATWIAAACVLAVTLRAEVSPDP